MANKHGKIIKQNIKKMYKHITFWDLSKLWHYPDFEGIVHPKLKILSRITHSHSLQGKTFSQVWNNQRVIHDKFFELYLWDDTYDSFSFRNVGSSYFFTRINL